MTKAKHCRLPAVAHNVDIKAESRKNNSSDAQGNRFALARADLDQMIAQMIILQVSPKDS